MQTYFGIEQQQSCYRNAAEYSAGLYCRLSSDDGREGDSTSIQTQKLILTKWCEEQGIRVHDTYVDDGYSGTNFNRPDFKRLIEDIESGKVNMVITKDLSRLGRDYIQTGYYTEMYFPDKAVRYVAINDGVDTLKADNDIAPFKNILNDMFAKDISRKVKAAKRQRALQGMYIASQAPFGYKQHPDNINKLIIDEEAAATVREIFRLACMGLGTTRIVKELTAGQYITPSAWKMKNGDNRFSRYYEMRGGEGSEYKWAKSTVMAIMRNRMYLGAMINRKMESVNYKTKKRARVPKERQIIVENMHEPIVGREEFEVVQRLMTARHTPTIHNFDNIFKSILFCMDCGKRMTLAYKDIKTYGGKFNRRTYYRCMHKFNSPGECSHYNCIYYEDLHAIVSERLKAFFALMKDDAQLAELVRQRSQKNEETERIEAEKQKIEKRLQILTKIIKKLYEDFAAEMIDATNYQLLMKDYYNEQKTLTARQEEINKMDTGQNRFGDNLQKLKEYANIYLDEVTLTREMINKLIERIEVNRFNTKSGEKWQEINIVYRFIGAL